MKTNYVLIDYENVQPKNLAVLNGHPVKVIIFLGAGQTKVSVELLTALQLLGSNFECVKITGNGRNALDFHIAFAIGELSASDKTASFHVISKDSGFDPLIEHLRTKGISAHRSRDLAQTPILKKGNSKGATQKLEHIVRNLSSRGTGKPRKLRTLSNTINALFAKSLEEEELQSLIKALETHGHISIEGGNVAYHLPEKP